MKTIIAVLLMLAFVQSAEAKPRWRTIGRIALYVGAGVATFEVAHQTNRCRERVDVARCQGGYGEVGARQIANGLLTGGTISLSEFGHRKKFKEWFLPVAAMTAYNTTTAIQQARIH